MNKTSLRPHSGENIITENTIDV